MPALANLHSATPSSAAWPGSPSGAATDADTFWTWRETMYRFALAMSPDDVEAVAAQLYVEMLEAGFAAVGEFHYLHHAPDGAPYAAPAEMAGAHRRRGAGDGHRPDAAAGLLCPRRLRRRAAASRSSGASSPISTASRACSTIAAR